MATQRPPKTSPRRKSPLKLPAILLEGDHPEMPQISGPGIKYALGPTAPAHHFENEPAELPSTYGTKRLFLIPRDPHWFHAHWDFPQPQQARYNKLSADRHLVLRVYADAAKGEPIAENHVHPESRHWFTHVEQAGAKYVAELGYYRQKTGRRAWTRVAVSQPVVTPPASASADTNYQQATIPFEVPLLKLAMMTRHLTGKKQLPLARALEFLRTYGREPLPSHPISMTAIDGPAVNEAIPWTPSQQQALAELLADRATTLSPANSVSITELVRKQIEQATGPSRPQRDLPTSPGDVSIPSSPVGGMRATQKSFWFNINAELVVYGATEPDAKVTIAGRAVSLRPDGTFSLRFSLPDGQYELPVAAVSADGTEGRGVELKFARATEHRGDVGVQPPNAALKPPLPENI